MKTLLLSVFIFLSGLSCNPRQNYIVFGSGGGFTGQVTAYKLLKNGKISKGSGISEISYTEYSNLKKSKANKIFNELNELKIVTFSKPGNIYYFITIYKDGKEVDFRWGANGFEPPGQLVAIYRSLMSDVSEIVFRDL